MKNAWKGKSHHDFYEKGLARFLHAERLGHVNRAISRIMEGPDAGAAKTLIDLGCGDGVLTANIGTRGLKVMGTDIDLDRVRKAVSHSASGESYAVSDVMRPPFRAGSADIVLIHHVIEHLEGNDGNVLSECYRLLKGGGYLIVGVPNEDSLMGRISRRMHPRLYSEGEHVNFYSESSIISLLTSVGFDVQSIGRIGFLFPLYYLHMALISVKPLFYAGHYLTKILKNSADSLIIICRKSE